MRRRELFLSGLAGAAGLPLPAANDAPPPDLGNLYPILSAISAGQSRRLSFLDPRWESLAEGRR